MTENSTLKTYDCVFRLILPGQSKETACHIHVGAENQFEAHEKAKQMWEKLVTSDYTIQIGEIGGKSGKIEVAS